jgi:AraC family transcriptional regulator
MQRMEAFGQLRGDPAEQIARLLDHPPIVAPEVLRGETRLTRRWQHGEVHGYLPEMSAHVLMTYFTVAGSVTWQSGGDRLTGHVRPGVINLIPEGRDGSWDIAGSLDVSHVYLSDVRLRQCAETIAGGRRFELMQRAGHPDPVAARILQLLAEEATNPDPASSLFMEQAVDLLCTHLLREHSSLDLQPSDEPRRGLAPWQVKRVTRYMIDHLDECVTLDALADLVNLSRHHFCTAFRLATGRPPYEWLLAERIARASSLLASTCLPVTEIALSVGYATPSAFATAFRRQIGLTPSAFRRRT